MVKAAMTEIDVKMLHRMITSILIQKYVLRLSANQVCSLTLTENTAILWLLQLYESSLPTYKIECRTPTIFVFKHALERVIHRLQVV